MHELSVSQFLEFLNEAMRTIVDPAAVAVVGEVAEYKVSQGKWVWFKLKDESADGVMDCFWTTFSMKEPLEDGMKIRAYGSPKVHPRSGKFSFNIVRVELVGEGALKRSYELLKKKLADEGLFDPLRKRSLPRFPQTIGLITSREAAACTDFLRILHNRWGGVRVELASVAVQGECAIAEITGAFAYFNALPIDERPDVLILTRGGGSMEDMKAFNSEEIARAVYSSRIPVVCGVGHERDESLADFAADVRASTPSNAAERVVPDRREIAYMVDTFADACEHGMMRGLERKGERVMRAMREIERVFVEQKHRFARLWERIEERFARRRAAVAERIDGHVRLLGMANPELQLKRGWSVVRNAAGKVVRDREQVGVGEELVVRMWKGELTTEVKDVH